MSLLQHYRLIDRATQGYILLVALLIVCFHHRIEHAPWLFAAHAAACGLVHGLIHWQARRPQGRALELLREFYPVLLYTAFYCESGLLNQMLIHGTFDAAFFRWEKAWLGWQPGLELMNRWPSRWAAEVLYGAYFSYYLMIVGVGVALYLRNRLSFRHYLTVVSLVFYACYFIYCLLPVVGPRILYLEEGVQRLAWPEPLPNVPETVAAAWMYQVMDFIYEHFETPGAAFPSSHVAIALCTLRFSWSYLPRIRLVHTVLVALLCVSTVYGRYHYVIDVVAGVAWAALLIPLAETLHRRERHEPGANGARPNG